MIENNFCLTLIVSKSHYAKVAEYLGMNLSRDFFGATFALVNCNLTIVLIRALASP